MKLTNIKIHIGKNESLTMVNDIIEIFDNEFSGKCNYNAHGCTYFWVETFETSYIIHANTTQEKGYKEYLDCQKTAFNYFDILESPKKSKGELTLRQIKKDKKQLSENINKLISEFISNVKPIKDINISCEIVSESIGGEETYLYAKVETDITI